MKKIVFFLVLTFIITLGGNASESSKNEVKNNDGVVINGDNNSNIIGGGNEVGDCNAIGNNNTVYCYKDKKVKLPSKPPGGWVVDATINVPAVDKNGQSWGKTNFLDTSTAPNIAICIGITLENQENIQCKPFGKYGLKGWGVIAAMPSDCRKSFRCTYEDVIIPEEEFEVLIVNVNWKDSQIMTKGKCKLKEKSINKPCKLDNGITIEFDWNKYY